MEPQLVEWIVKGTLRMEKFPKSGEVPLRDLQSLNGTMDHSLGFVVSNYNF